MTQAHSHDAATAQPTHLSKRRGFAAALRECYLAAHGAFWAGVARVAMWVWPERNGVPEGYTRVPGYRLIGHLKKGQSLNEWVAERALKLADTIAEPTVTPEPMKPTVYRAESSIRSRKTP